MKIKHHIVVVLFVSISLIAEGKNVKILGIGNSFTRNATRFLPQILESDPDNTALVTFAYIGGCSLEKHVTLANAHEQDSCAGMQYLYTVNGKQLRNSVSLKSILVDQEWDYITIQQVSSESYKLERFYPYAGELVDYVRRYCPDAEILVHETWAHSPASERVQKWDLPPAEMYKLVHANYQKIADEFGFRVIPAGTAIINAQSHPLWNYQPEEPDPTVLKKTLRYPDLPDMSKSLHHDYYWSKKGDSGQHNLRIDGFHLNPKGEYLAGLVWYECFFGKDARAVTYQPDFLTTEQADSLKQIAHEAFSAKSDDAQ